MKSTTEEAVQKANKQLLAAIRKLPQQPLIVVGVLAGFAFFGTLFLLSSQAAAPGKSTAYFVLESAGQAKPFVIALQDPVKIQQARTFSQHSWTVTGDIVKERADYNTNWSFHVNPASVRFVDEAGGSCDAAPVLLEANLAAVGTSVLPGGHWCPTAVTSLREVTK